jgi:hypothetical protein
MANWASKAVKKQPAPAKKSSFTRKPNTTTAPSATAAKPSPASSGDSSDLGQFADWVKGIVTSHPIDRIENVLNRKSR